MVRDLRATTTASTASRSGALGTPIACTTRMPERTRLLARSVAPVKSSAMQPRNTVMEVTRGKDSGNADDRRCSADEHTPTASKFRACVQRSRGYIEFFGVRSSALHLRSSAYYSLRPGNAKPGKI